MAEYSNPFKDLNQLYTYYQPLKQPSENSKVTFKNPIFGDQEFSEGFIERNGTYIAPPNTPETQEYVTNNYDDLFKEMGDRHSESTEDNNLNNTSIGITRKGNQKELLLSTIDKLSQEDENIKNIKGFLLDTAALESGFKLNSSSKASSASGWFGFIDSTKRQFAPGISRNDFNNNPEIQIKAATNLYYSNLNTAKKLGLLDAAKKKGYSTDDVIHAMWLNPKWATKFFLYGEKGGKDAFGTDIEKYLKMIHGRK